MEANPILDRECGMRGRQAFPDKAFKDLKIVPVAELVFYGVQSV